MNNNDNIYDILPTLSIGSTGEFVKILQEKLRILNFYNASTTGSFGQSTFDAVILFQSNNNLNPDGIVGSKTWQKLYEETEVKVKGRTTYPTLTYGSYGENVNDLQTKLSALLYYNNVINSLFDKNTLDAVKRFQLNNRITSDGIVGNVTWTIINRIYGKVSCSNNEVNNKTYTVLKGDTLYSIARKFNTSVNELMSLNNLTSNTISIGQVLKLPNTSLPETNKTYSVVKGDTLYSIARKFNTSVNELISLNKLTSNILYIGQILKIK